MIMKKIKQSIVIDTPREVVWAAIIDDQKYRLWAAVFEPGSFFVGGWQQGQTIKFTNQYQDQSSGMFAEIAVNEHLRRISIHHIGLINGDKVDYDSTEAQKWVPAYENYELEPITDQSTRFSVDVDVNEEYFEEFTESWTKALQKLKEICEQNLAPLAKIEIGRAHV